MKRFMDLELTGVDGQLVPRDIVVPYVDREEAERLVKALDEIPYTLSSAATIFKMFWRMAAGGYGPEESELCAVCDLAAKALDRAAGSDTFHLDQFRINLKTAMECTERRLETYQDKRKA